MRQMDRIWHSSQVHVIYCERSERIVERIAYAQEHPNDTCSLNMVLSRGTHGMEKVQTL